MDRISYAGHTVITGTAIARALLEYAQALSQAGGSATVEIPTLRRDGSRGRSLMLVGPASQLISDEEDSPYDDVTDAGLVRFLGREAVKLRVQGMPSGVAATGASSPAEWFEFES